MAIAIERVRLDLQELTNRDDHYPIIFTDHDDDNPLRLQAAILGPSATPYENGVFLLSLVLDDMYPFAPPVSVTFNRATMHPNVTEHGRFLSDLLSTEHWTPAMTIAGILEHVWARLAVPDVDSDKCDAERARLYRTDPDLFGTQAREYSVKYAAAS